MSVLIIVALAIGLGGVVLAIVGLVLYLQAEQPSAPASKRKTPSAGRAVTGEARAVRLDEASQGVAPMGAPPLREVQTGTEAEPAAEARPLPGASLPPEPPVVEAVQPVAPAARQFLALALQSEVNVVVVVPPGLDASATLSQLMAPARVGRRPVALHFPVDVIQFITRSRGNLGLVEAGDPYVAVATLEALYAQSSPALSVVQVSETIPMAVDLLVWVYVAPGRAPVVRQISELSFDPDGRDGNGKTLITPIFRWDPAVGDLRPTGVRPATLVRIQATVAKAG